MTKMTMEEAVVASTINSAAAIAVADEVAARPLLGMGVAIVEAE